MLSIRQIYAEAHENAPCFGAEIWIVHPSNGRTFEVAGEMAARRWKERLGEDTHIGYTGRNELPTVG